ncbi:MAG: hypothetical protein K6G63_00220 [Eubacterium sp.]|nr:hypothetical protein [Eubacterium sp.]
MNNSNRFIQQTIKKYIIPTILGILGSTIVGFVNTLLAGQCLGKDALTAMNILTSFTFLYAMFGCLINIGASTIASVAMGRGDDKTVGEYEVFAFATSIIVPIVVSVVIIIFLRPILFLLGADETLYAFMRSYALITIIFGFLTTLMYFPFNFLRVDGRAQVTMLIFGAMALVDIVLLIIFLKLGMGLKGVAIANTLGTGTANILGIGILFFGKNRQIVPRIPSADNILLYVIYTCRTGAPSGLNNLCNMARTMMINATVLSILGRDEASEFAVACTILNFASAVVFGPGQTIVPLIGVFYGEKDYLSIKTTMRQVTKSSLILIVSVAILIMAFAYPLLHFFGIRTTNIFSGGTIAIWFAALSMIPSTVLNIYIFYYSTVREVGISLALTFCRAFLFVVMLVNVLIGVGLGKWYMSSFVLGELLTIAVMFGLANMKRKKNPEKKSVLLLEEIEEYNVIAFSVPGDKDGAVEASRQVEEFFEDKDFSPKLVMQLSLALEELLVICGEKCLENNNTMFEDVRIMIYNNSSIILRIRCGGKMFDPIEWYREREANMTPEEMLENMSMGIRMIDKKSKAILYKRTLGVNNLIVEL